MCCAMTNLVLFRCEGGVEGSWGRDGGRTRGLGELLFEMIKYDKILQIHVTDQNGIVLTLLCDVKIDFKNEL